MCLRTNENHYKVADKPITCYKTVNTIIQKSYPAHVFTQHFTSTFYNFEYELNTLHSLKETDYFILNNPIVDGMLYINVGFHSFATLTQAKNDCIEYDKQYIKKVLANRYLPHYMEVILKCEIPKDAKYWVGNKDLTHKNYMEYCSNQIKVVGWKFNGEKNWRKTVVKPRKYKKYKRDVPAY